MHAVADWLVDLVGSIPSWAVYVIASAVVYAETATLIAGLILPSEATLLAAGVAAAVGPTEIAALIVVVCVFAVAGDITGYWIGSTSGERIRSSRTGRRFGEQRWETAQRRIGDDGVVAVITGRWIGYVRTIVPPVAGMAGMRMIRFGVADVIGATSWASTVLLVGYFAGAALGASMLMWATGAAILTGAGFYAYRSWRERR